MSVPTRDLPRAGDIVVYRHGGSAGVDLLSSFQRACRLTFQAHDDAVRDAARIAATDHVDAWYTADGETYRSLARHRGGICIAFQRRVKGRSVARSPA